MNIERSRWVGVGHAAVSDTQPGTVAARQALQHDDVKLLIVFCSAALDLRAVLEEIRAEAGPVVLSIA